MYPTLRALPASCPPILGPVFRTSASIVAWPSASPRLPLGPSYPLPIPTLESRSVRLRHHHPPIPIYHPASYILTPTSVSVPHRPRFESCYESSCLQLPSTSYHIFVLHCSYPTFQNPLARPAYLVSQRETLKGMVGSERVGQSACAMFVEVTKYQVAVVS
ncbi:hypothetical protein L226DRAFT_156947 [Lentinus tigrinus ALCF2SS1-7]|uniref:uncharacterized protein n=1 Tax=Lentinus tigrinus ALCF2SS1-7 TaxID=1328758 RepID=UPI001165EFD1|nr:hypothetical protein L226DRAFT_156947 [Lentinus tigrinus ALCF2SS1-7]